MSGALAPVNLTFLSLHVAFDVANRECAQEDARVCGSIWISWILM